MTFLYRDERDSYGRWVRPQVVPSHVVEWVQLESGRQEPRLIPVSIFLPSFKCRMCGAEPRVKASAVSTYHETMLCRRCRFGSKRDAGRGRD